MSAVCDVCGTAVGSPVELDDEARADGVVLMCAGCFGAWLDDADVVHVMADDPVLGGEL